MKISAQRRDGILLFMLEGRLNGHGGTIFKDLIRDAFHDDDISATVDMSRVEYLSSAGIRTLLVLGKEVHRRGGMMALSGVQEFPLKVLRMAGFQSIFSIVPTIEEALALCQDADIHPGLPSVKQTGVLYRFEEGAAAPAHLKVRGSLATLLHARITEDDLRQISFSSIDYSIGLGALGADAASALPLLGEMITLHQTMVWLPTDGCSTPDFLTPGGDDPGIPVYTAFNVTLEGPFHEYITFESDDPAGITLADLYRQIISSAHARHTDFKGVLALAIAGISAGLIGSGIVRAPLLEYSGGLTGTIMDEGSFQQWIAINEDPLYDGDTLVTFGFGVDVIGDLSAYDPAALHSLAYVHPANKGQADLKLHNHGVIFQGRPWDRNTDLRRQIQTLIDEGEVADMRHLLDTTRLRRGRIGVSYISGIIME